MTYDYDKLYASTPDALGPPTQIFVDFFDGQKGANLSVLDVGCGQGRDALFIARAGHRVTGVDYAPSGIRDLTAAAESQGLPITGLVADITDYTPEQTFDVVLIDRTLHMLDEAPRLQALETLAGCVAPNGWLLIADETSNLPAFLEVLDAMSATWRTDLHKRGTLFLQRSS